MRESLSLSSYRDKAGGTEQNPAKGLIVLPVVKPQSTSAGFRTIFCKSRNWQATDKMSIDKMMDTLALHK